MATLPFVVGILGVMVPSFLVRHPPPPTHNPSKMYSPYGPPTAPPVEVRTPSELSKDFFRNLRDLQNTMDDFSSVYDAVVRWIAPVTNFSDEGLSSALFLCLYVLVGVTFVFSKLIPWRLIVLVTGWSVTSLGHPAVRDLLLSARKMYIEPREPQARYWITRWVEQEFTVDLHPETSEVEVFELQRRSSGTGEWEAWLFSAAPYDPLDSDRVAGSAPCGTRFLEDVLPPLGWVWNHGKKWTLDLHSEEWVQERYITAVEIETEGERWVYDLSSQGESLHHRTTGTAQATDHPNAGPDERLGPDGDGEYWRRRRWCRQVRRKVMQKRR